MAVDCVVVNYHTDELLRNFVHSYAEHRFGDSTLTVVDVEIADREETLSSWDGVPYYYIGFRENVGYARACNAGAETGTNDVILLANADTLLTGGLRACYEALMEREDWGILGPRQVNEQHCITAGGIFGTEYSIGQRGWNEVDVGQYSDVREDAKSVSGSLYFIKRKVWQELTDCQYMQEMYPGIEGAFIPTPHYYEETCCSYHARAHGYKVVYYGPVQMIHYWHKASNHGGWADMQVDTSKRMMREFLDSHGIAHE
jgi:GT2 family glycosyltransferase